MTQRGSSTVDVDWSDHDGIAADLGWPFEEWTHQCHAVSIAIVKHYGVGRVARGSCRGVAGQHSWIVLGDDCFDPDTPIVDPTLWSYDDTVSGILVTSLSEGRHRPHGYSPDVTMIDWGCPSSGGGDHIDLTPTVPLSASARFWIDKMFRPAAGSLDRQFWSTLINHAPLSSWPVASEIVAAMDDTPDLAFLVPVDILGMFTDRNPGGLYLPGADQP